MTEKDFETLYNEFDFDDNYTEDIVPKRNNKFKDLTGQQFGQRKALEYDHDLCKWKCVCLTCGKISYISSNQLTSGKMQQCITCSNKARAGYKTDLTNKLIGHCKVIKYIGGSLWQCRCSCGKEINVKTFNLTEAIRLNRDYKCEECSYEDKRDKLEGKTFGNWYVQKYLGDGYYECKCNCEKGTVKKVYGKSLKKGASTSCGCLTNEKIINTRFKNYGDIATNKEAGSRTLEQINAVRSRDAFLEFINKYFPNFKPSAKQLERVLGISNTRILRVVHKFKLEDYINIYELTSSSYEDQIFELLKEHTTMNIIRGDRNVLNGRELDIYIPDKHLAIEFNGTYWHSSKLKDRLYHQQKTLDCAKQGIRLIHIFEYEWLNEVQKQKITDILLNVIDVNEIERVYGRHTYIKEIQNKEEVEDFLNMYHLQGYTKSTIDLGCYSKVDNDLLGVITLGKPRFNHEYEYEIIRLCWRPEVQVIGGTQKLFKHFIKEYNPTSVLTYTDISKFTGNIYTQLEFTPIQPNPLTEPSYVWVSSHNDKVIPRYQTQKQKLLELGLGTQDQTEDEIMENLDFIKVYNAGNLKLEWIRE